MAGLFTLARAPLDLRWALRVGRARGIHRIWNVFDVPETLPEFIPVVVLHLSERRKMWSETNPGLVILDLQTQETPTHHGAASVELRVSKSERVDSPLELLQGNPAPRVHAPEVVPKMLQGLHEHHDRDRTQLPIRGAPLRDPEQPGVSCGRDAETERAKMPGEFLGIRELGPGLYGWTDQPRHHGEGLEEGAGFRRGFGRRS